MTVLPFVQPQRKPRPAGRHDAVIGSAAAPLPIVLAERRGPAERRPPRDAFAIGMDELLAYQQAIMTMALEAIEWAARFVMGVA